MKKLVFALITASFCGAMFTGCGYKGVTNDDTKVRAVQVLTLGVFHFNFPNLDFVQTAEEDQIDVLLPEYQKEIELIVEKLLVFQPTVVVVEVDPDSQDVIDSLYNAYLWGKYALERNEIMQIGFRIAKARGLQKLYCVNDWGSFTENINGLLNHEESEEFLAFAKSFENNEDSSKVFHKEQLFKTKGKKLILLNAFATIMRFCIS